MKVSKLITVLGLCSLLSMVGCSKDKNMDDYRRDQLQESLARISSISGSYSGVAVSRLDGTNLGAIDLKFQARTDIAASSGNVSSQQNAIVSGSLSFRSLTNTEVVFDNGYYDDVTGDFQVTIPITQNGGAISKLSVIGQVSGNSWIGSIEVKGQPEFGAQLTLYKNAPPKNTSALEITGARMEQIRRLNLVYEGEYTVGGANAPFRLSFVNRDILPEQNFYKLFSPVRQVNVNCDFTDFELNFSNAILDDKMGTLVGHDPTDQRGTPARANLSCVKFDNGAGNYGWDCEIMTKITTVKIHLNAKN